MQPKLTEKAAAVEIEPTTAPLTLEQIDLINDRQTSEPAIEYNGGWHRYEDEYDFLRPMWRGVVLA